MADLKRYEKRYRALVNELSRMEVRYQEGGSLAFPRQTTIVQLVRGLRLFAQGQFLFFYHGFNGGGGDFPPLEHSKKYPPEHVLANIISQISADMEAIRAAAEQRILNQAIPPGNARKRRVDGTTKDVWAAADQLAMAALWPRKPKPSRQTQQTGQTSLDGDWEVKTVLTYLTNSVQARVMPYAQVVLLGIPHTCLVDLHAFLAIPHEVGHFRYWYSFQQARADLATRGPEWEHLENLWLNLRELFYPFNESGAALPWGQEIFCDAYGALVGGPLSILTGMDMAFEHSNAGMADFGSGDTHPAPLIRSLLTIKALKELNTKTRPDGARLLPLDANAVDSITIQLLNRWKRKLKERGVLVYRDDAGQENEDARDLRFEFLDAEVAKQVGKKIAWDTRLLDLRFPAEESVRQAVRALEYAFRDGLPPHYEWGWSTDGKVLTPRANLFDVNELYDNADRVIKKKLNSARQVTELNLRLLDEPQNESDTLPQLWREWVTRKGKGYFETIPTTEIKTGEFNNVMNPTTRPPNTWLPIFGAGGWTTEGPCADPPR